MSLADALRTYVDRANSGQPTSVQQLAEDLSLDYTELLKFFNYHPIVNKLRDDYDLPPPPKRLSRRSLTEQQRRWIVHATNPYTAKGIASLALEFGIDTATHRRWMKQAAFREAYNKALRQEIDGTEGEIARRAANRALTGDPKSVEMIYRITGKPLAALEQTTGSAGIPMDTILTALQRTLPPEQLARVAGELLNPTKELPPVEPEQPEDAEIVEEHGPAEQVP